MLNLAGDRRWFVVVGATCEGWCGILDLDRDTLEPIRCQVEPTA